MDNKYGLGSAKVAHAHHEATHKPMSSTPTICVHCGHVELSWCPTLNDHFCDGCGQYQEDVPAGYATGHNANY